jgi:hypothetical protein
VKILVPAVTKRLAVTQKTKPKEIRSVLRNAGYGEVSAWQARRVKKAILKVNDDEAMASFNKLPAYLNALKKSNPGTTTDLVLNEEGRFDRCFIAPQVCYFLT